MKVESELLIKQAILRSLKEGEQLLSFNFSKDRRSAYATLFRGKSEFLSFRISQHSAYKSFYSNRTFTFSESNPLKFQTDLAEYLENAEWYYFNYNDFYLLYSLKYSRKHRLTILIDNLYDVFSDEKMGIIFYQEKYLGKNKKENNIVSEGLTKCLRKLYATGLLSSIEPGKAQVQVFVTNQGWRMLDATLKVYLDRYVEDFEQINWFDFDLVACVKENEE